MIVFCIQPYKASHVQPATIAQPREMLPEQAERLQVRNLTGLAAPRPRDSVHGSTAMVEGF